MLKEILDAIRCQSEEVIFLGRAYLVREVDVSQSLAIEDELEKEIAADGASKADLLYWSIVVRSVFNKDDGMPAFAPADIRDLRKGARTKLAPLLNAVDRVNGLDAGANEKK